MHALMKTLPGYKKINGGYRVNDSITCKDGYQKAEDRCIKPKSKKLKASKESKSLSGASRNERTRIVNSLKKKRFAELEDLTDAKWKNTKRKSLN
jgi:hypothetical protein